MSDPLLAVRLARARLEAARTLLVDRMRTAEQLGATQREIGLAGGFSQAETWRILRGVKLPR